MHCAAAQNEDYHCWWYTAYLNLCSRKKYNIVFLAPNNQKSCGHYFDKWGQDYSFQFKRVGRSIALTASDRIINKRAGIPGVAALTYDGESRFVHFKKKRKLCRVNKACYANLLSVINVGFYRCNCKVGRIKRRKCAMRLQAALEYGNECRWRNSCVALFIHGVIICKLWGRAAICINIYLRGIGLKNKRQHVRLLALIDKQFWLWSQFE